MRGARWAAVATVAAVALAGCSGNSDAGSQAESASPTTTATDLIGGGAPSFAGALPVRMVSGLRVMGLGCRPTSPRDACAVDGSQTYTWLAPRHRVTVTSVRTRLDRDHGAWIVSVRFSPEDRKVVRETGSRSGSIGGYALVLDDQSGDALQAAAPVDVDRGRITVHNLVKSDAWDLVDTYLTAAATAH